MLLQPCFQALEDQGEDMEAASVAAVASAAASEDLHASLETQLRGARADIGRLQSELKRLKAAAETAPTSIAVATSPVGRDLPSAEEQQQLQNQLHASEAQCKKLQAEVTQLRASTAAESPVSRDGSQTASVSGRSTGARGPLPNGLGPGLCTTAPCLPENPYQDHGCCQVAGICCIAHNKSCLADD